MGVNTIIYPWKVNLLKNSKYTLHTVLNLIVFDIKQDLGEQFGKLLTYFLLKYLTYSLFNLLSNCWFRMLRLEATESGVWLRLLFDTVKIMWILFFITFICFPVDLVVYPLTLFYIGNILENKNYFRFFLEDLTQCYK